MIKSLNQIAMKNAAQSHAITRKTKSKYTTLDFNGIALVSFNQLLKHDSVKMNIVPYKFPLPRNYSKVWPTYHYDFDFRGTLAKDGFIDVQFYYGGLDIMAGEQNNIRIIQWDKKKAKDITTHVDTKRKLISGRTNKLTTFSIVRRVNRQ